MTHWIHAPAYAVIVHQLWRELRDQRRWRLMRESYYERHTHRPLHEGLDPQCPGCKQQRADWLADMERE